MHYIVERGIEYGLQFGLGLSACLSKNPEISQSPRLPLYKEKLRILTKLRKNEGNAKGKQAFLFISECNGLETCFAWLVQEVRGEASKL